MRVMRYVLEHCEKDYVNKPSFRERITAVDRACKVSGPHRVAAAAAVVAAAAAAAAAAVVATILCTVQRATLGSAVERHAWHLIYATVPMLCINV